MSSPQGKEGSDGSCLVCGHPHWRLVIRSEDIEYRCKPGLFDLVECTRCGHIYVHPLPSYEEIPSLYPNTYYTVNKRSPLYLDGAIYEKKLGGDARKMRRSLAPFHIRSIVDVGAGEISRLAKLKEAFGGKVEAIAFDIQFEPNIEVEARKHGIQLVHGNVETNVDALRDEGHDLIIMRQLLEHLRDPQQAVSNLARKLAPNGLIVIDTPNRGGLDYWLFRKKHWGGYHVPRHFHLFNQESLVKIVERAGLEVYRKGYLPSMGFWIISLRNMLGLNSIERGPSFWEFLRYKNLLVAGTFILFDAIRARLGFQTSNQFIIARKRAQ